VGVSFEGEPSLQRYSSAPEVVEALAVKLLCELLSVRF